MKARTIFHCSLLCLFFLGLLPTAGASAQAPAVLTVNSTGDATDASIGDGICATSGGVCTLRAAIQEGNFDTKPHEIRFNITGGGPYVISPRTPLPSLYNNTSVVGPNQDFSSVILDGAGAGDNASGLGCGGNGGVTIKGMRIQNFTRAGIFVTCIGGGTFGGSTPAERNVLVNNQSGVEVYTTANNIAIVGNYIGIDSGGSPLPNREGIKMTSTSNGITNVTISDNVISGNSGRGIYISSLLLSGIWIEGNTIGTNPSGSAAVPNGSAGIQVSYSSTVYIGSASKGNLISGNGGEGIVLQGCSGVLVQNNRMSTNSAATAYLPNAEVDLRINYGEVLTIGGDSAGVGNVMLRGMVLGGDSSNTSQGNVVKNNWIGASSSGAVRPEAIDYGLQVMGSRESEISYNKVTGFSRGIVIYSSATGILLSKNRVWGNAALGIDLNIDGVTPNDPLDADSGANGLQNYPQFGAYVWGGPIYFADLSGTLESKPNTAYTIEIFTSERCHAGGYGEGEQYFGNAVVTTGADGFGSWKKNGILLSGTVTCFTATARQDSNGNTSEFSRGVYAIAGPKSFLPAVMK